MTRKQRTSAAAGILAPLIAFIFIIAAVASDPPFTWTNNALSDLGIVSGITAYLFNFGLVACGCLALCFTMFGLLNYLKKNWISKIGSAFFAAGALALISIGVFNENFSPIHFLVSVAFFVSLPISLFIITGAFVIYQQAKMALFTLFVAMAAVIPWILYFTINYVPGKAIPEFISGFAGAIWIIVLGVKILKAENEVKPMYHK